MVDVRRTQLEGMAELKRGLAELGDEVSTRIGVTANRKAAQHVRTAAENRAPRGTGPTKKTRKLKGGASVEYDYGRLYQNIKMRKVRARKEHTIVYQVTTGRAFWGYFLERGTSRMGAKPWFRPAFDTAAPEALNVQITELRSGIDRAAKRAARKARKAARG